MRLLAIDPGPTHSAYVLTDDLTPLMFDKLPNDDLLQRHHLFIGADQVAIEQIGHYGTGMPAGTSVFDTCIWIGRFIQACSSHNRDVALVKRAIVKAHLCGAAKAKDGNVIQALIDRFAPDTGNHGKGYKNMPGWFYGFHSDLWQAYALAVYALDMQKEETA